MGAHLGLVLASLGKRDQAEALWNEVASGLSPGYAETVSILQAVAGFFEQWEQEHPGQGYGARAVQWRSRLSEMNLRSSLATAPSSMLAMVLIER